MARDEPLALQYPCLYNIVQRKEVFIASVLGQVPLIVAFRRPLTWERWTDWLHLVNRLHLINRLMMVTLTEEPDTFRWKLITFGVFSVKSMYTDLINDLPAVSSQVYLEA